MRADQFLISRNSPIFVNRRYDHQITAIGEICQITQLLGTFVNMAATFVLYEFNLWKLAKGVIVAVIPYMAAAIILL